MTTAARSVRFEGWDAKREELEEKRSEKGFKQRKELKERKRVLKKAKIEQQAQRLRENGELDFFLRYLYYMGPDQRRQLIEGQEDIALLFQAMFRTPDFHGALSQRLDAWMRDDRSFFLEVRRNRLFILTILESMKEDRCYTALDRFLQYLFRLDDDMLRQYFLSVGDDGRGDNERVDIQGLLRPLYQRPNEPDITHEECMRRFLRRTLREADLRRGQPPHPQVPFGVQAFRRLEEIFVAMRWYVREGQENADGILTSGSSDAEEEKQEQ